MGRPPRYKTAASPLPAVLDALRRGKAMAAACRFAGVGVETVEGWCAKDPAVRAQVEGARAWGEAQGQKDEGPGSGGASPGPFVADGGQPRVKPTPPVRAAQDPWARAHEEAAALGPGLFGYLLWLEARIGEHNEKAPAWDQLPPMPAPVLEMARDFWASGKQELAILGGRGLGKTTLFCRFTIIECLFGPPVVNGGEIAIWAELAQDMDAAQLALGVLEKLLQIAGFQRATKADEEKEHKRFRTLKQERGRSRIKFLNVHSESIEIRVFPATVEALSGPTLKGARHDEEQKWRANAKDGTSSAEDVIDAEGGAFRGRAHAHLYRMSSAYSTKTPHHRDTHGIVVDDDGHETRLPDPDTAERMVARIGAHLELARAGFEARASASRPADAAEIRAFAASLTAASPEIPSWWNPSLDPRKLKARSVRIFLREYGSRTTEGGDEGDFFDGLLLDAAEARARPPGEPDATFAAIDTGAKRNPAALAIVGRWETEDGQRFAPLLLRAWKPAPGAPLDLRLKVLPAMAALTKKHGADGWASDGFASHDVELVAGEQGLAIEFVATSEAHRDVYAPVAAGLGREELCLSGCEGAAEAVAQLRQVSSEAELSGSGARVRIVVPEDAGGEHGDLGVALVRALARAGCGLVDVDDGGAIGEPSRYAREFNRRRVA